MTRTKFITEIRERLVHRRTALRQAIAGDERLLRSLGGESGGDEIDAALATEQAELHSQMAEVESREVAQIDRALEKIRAGKYGRCETCEKPIGPMRLKYLPYAADCIHCARKEERRDARALQGSPVNRIAAFTRDDDEREPAASDARIEIG